MINESVFAYVPPSPYRPPVNVITPQVNAIGVPAPIYYPELPQRTSIASACRKLCCSAGNCPVWVKPTLGVVAGTLLGLIGYIAWKKLTAAAFEMQSPPPPFYFR